MHLLYYMQCWTIKCVTHQMITANIALVYCFEHSLEPFVNLNELLFVTKQLCSKLKSELFPSFLVLLQVNRSVVRYVLRMKVQARLKRRSLKSARPSSVMCLHTPVCVCLRVMPSSVTDKVTPYVCCHSC